MHPIFGPDGTALGDSVEHWIMDGARLVALVVFPSFMSGRCRIWFQAEVTLLAWRRATPTYPLRDNRSRHQEPANATSHSQSPASRSPPKGAPCLSGGGTPDFRRGANDNYCYSGRPRTGASGFALA
jgi:hypothetical protein